MNPDDLELVLYETLLVVSFHPAMGMVNHDVES
jgi:hypothetical protein